MISKKFIKKTKKKGTLFWIEGFSGAGKTSISRVTAKILRKKISNLVLIQGNEMRSLLQLKGFSKKERISASNYSSELIKFLTNNGINVMSSEIINLIESQTQMFLKSASDEDKEDEEYVKRLNDIAKAIYLITKV